ncbi:MAG: hypothetical protein Kow00128_00830 [Deltaproteobacteria bacterium]
MIAWKGRWTAGAGRIAALVVLTGLACAGWPRAGFAQDNTVRLTLEEAVRIAVTRNRDVQAAAEYRRQVTGRYVEERAAALPQVTVTAGISRNHDESQKAFGGGFIPVESDTRSVEAGLTQPLFTWGQVGAAIRAARHGVATAGDRLRIFRQAAVRDVTAAFHDILLARDLHRIAQQNLEQKIRHREEAERKEAAGTATDYDVLAARVGVENARPEVIRTENRIRISRDRLRFLLALSDPEIDVEGSLESPVAPPPEYDAALAEALRNRPEFSEIRRRKAIAGELVRVADAGDKPRIDLRAGYGWRDLDVGISEADGRVWSAGIFATWPLFDGRRTRGRVAQAESDLRTLAIEEEKLRDAIALEVRGAVDAVREAGGIVRALEGTVGQAQRLLAMAEKGFEYGVKTRIEVEDAELSLVQAQGNLARARRDYLVARTDLAYATGTLVRDEDAAKGKESGWAPAESVPGLVLEVLRNDPPLVR